MIWLMALALGAMLVGGGVVARALSRAPRVATVGAVAGGPSAATLEGRAAMTVPRDAHTLEVVAGAGIALAAVVGIVGPTLLDPLDAGVLGAIPTPALLALVGGAGALVAAGPRGRARFTAALAVILGLFVAGRRSHRWGMGVGDRLAMLGRSTVLAALLGALAIVCLAKPWITPHTERSFGQGATASIDGMPPVPAALLAELAAHADDPRAATMRAMLGLPAAPAPTHFTLDGYTAERNVAWPVTGAALLLLAMALVLSPGGLSAPRRPMGARS